MLLIARKGREQAVMQIFTKWGLNAVVIGQVTGGHRMRVHDGAELVADIPVSALTDEAPIYRRLVKRPRYLAKVQRLSLRAIPQPRDAARTLRALLASPTIASKASVFEQYDHMVQTSTVVLPGRADAAVLRVKGTGTLLAATLDGNGTYAYLDPYEGGKAAVAEAARNLVCVGARPLAVTNCLNFGNPQDPEIMWQLKECVRGISDACRAFGTPVTGGNVSLYNESPRGAIDPTPVIGMIGVTTGAPITMGFQDEGDVIVLFGTTREELGGSEYLKLIHHRKQGKPPRIDLAKERALHQLMREASGQGLLKSAHDCSEGGLAVALAECCIVESDHLIGAVIEPLSDRAGTHAMRLDAILFGESAGRIVVSCVRFVLDEVLRLAQQRHLKATVLGKVGGRRLTIAPWLDAPVEELSTAWRTGLQTHG
jgi:phosphoribosylformylglycinamidine synthase